MTKPSIAEMQRVERELSGSLPLTDYMERLAELRLAAPVLLEIAAAALALDPELQYLQGPLSARLREALAKVRP